MDRSMNIYKKLILLAIFVILILVTFFEEEPEYKGACARLEDLALDPLRVSHLQNWVDSFEDVSYMLKSNVTSSGFIDVYKYPENFNLDWRKVGIPIGLASIRINGIDIDYLNLDLTKIDSFSIGFGGRSFLVFKYKDNSDWGLSGLNVAENNKKIINNIMLVCRNN